MKSDIGRDLFQLCLNSLHGKDSFLYKELSRERIAKLCAWITEEEHKAMLKAVDRFKGLPREEQEKFIEGLKEVLREGS